MLTKSTFLRFAFLLVFSNALFSNVYAQNENVLVAKKNAMKITPSAFAVSTFSLSYERHLSQNMSFQFTGGITERERGAYQDNIFSSNSTTNNGGYPNNNPNGSQNLQDKISGGFGEGALRFYFVKGKSVISGLYAGPYFRYCAYKYYVNYGNDPYSSSNAVPAMDEVANYTTKSYEGGVLFGWQWVIKNSFLFDMYVGGGVRSSDAYNKPANYGSSDYSFKYFEHQQNTTGVIAKIGFKLGFVF
ncbi:MAG: hypothetical protein H7259_07890 [Cytophagales bacterium]|nr:hypothetical protein [Cytophaga sp.]